MKDDEKNSFYDKLGDLLSETLEAGHVQFVKVERPPVEEETPPFKKEGTSTNAESGTHDSERSTFSSQNGASSASNSSAQNASFRSNFSSNSNSSAQNSSSQNTSSPKKNYVYKKITPEIQRAYRLLGISISANLEDLKKAYKEKIKYYHPDKYQNNPVLAKVAGDKTHQVIQAYNLLLDFIGNR